MVLNDYWGKIRAVNLTKNLEKKRGSLLIKKE
jgi:hypothetical protein